MKENIFLALFFGILILDSSQWTASAQNYTEMGKETKSTGKPHLHGKLFYQF